MKEKEVDSLKLQISTNQILMDGLKAQKEMYKELFEEAREQARESFALAMSLAKR